MLTQYPTLIISVTAQQEFPKNLFVGFDGNLPAADSKALGVIDADTKEGNQMPVIVSGVALVKTASAVNVGDAITTDAAGYAKPVTGSEKINGYALDTATGTMQLIRVLLK
jgi:hypothetical protein